MTTSAFKDFSSKYVNSLLERTADHCIELNKSNYKEN